MTMIAIKGIKMPENCMNCPLFDGEYGDCNIIGETKADATEERAECCPLVEIVTCKDCDNRCTGGLCTKHNITVTKDFYCGDAEKRE